MSRVAEISSWTNFDAFSAAKRICAQNELALFKKSYTIVAKEILLELGEISLIFDFISVRLIYKSMIC